MVRSLHCDSRMKKLVHRTAGRNRDHSWCRGPRKRAGRQCHSRHRQGTSRWLSAPWSRRRNPRRRVVIGDDDHDDSRGTVRVSPARSRRVHAHRHAREFSGRAIPALAEAARGADPPRDVGAASDSGIGAGRSGQHSVCVLSGVDASHGRTAGGTSADAAHEPRGRDCGCGPRDDSRPRRFRPHPRPRSGAESVDQRRAVLGERTRGVFSRTRRRLHRFDERDDRRLFRRVRQSLRRNP